jgi:hypothetical protein
MASKLFPKNVHQVERLFRVLVGLFVLSLIFWGPTSLWGLLGLGPLITGLMGTCPMYTIFGVSSCKKCEDKQAASLRA